MISTSQVKSATRLINNTPHNVLIVKGLDRVQINTRLHYLNEQISKLQQRQAELVESRDAMDRKIVEMEEGIEAYWDRSGQALFDDMFGGWSQWDSYFLQSLSSLLLMLVYLQSIQCRRFNNKN